MKLSRLAIMLGALVQTLGEIRMRALNSSEIESVFGGSRIEYEEYAPKKNGGNEPSLLEKIINYFTVPDHQSERVSQLEAAGWDCYPSSASNVVCYDEDRDNKAVVFPNGVVHVSPYDR